MCIAVYKPAGKVLTSEVIKACFDNNADGAGFTAQVDGTLNTHRGFFTLDQFKSAFEPYKQAQAILHFRIRTHGDYSAENTHPHHVSTNLAFAHNGVISGLPYNKDKSDTVLLNELVLQDMVKRYGKKIIFNKSFQLLLDKFIGGSRLCFLSNQGQYLIFPESSGVWDEGVWFSNSTYKPRQVYLPRAETQGETEDHSWGHDQEWDAKQKRWRKRRQRGNKSEAKSAARSALFTTPRKVDYATTFREVGETLQWNDWVRLSVPWGGIPENSIGRIRGFYQHGDIEVFFPTQKTGLKIPPHYIEVLARATQEMGEWDESGHNRTIHPNEVN